MTRRKLPWRAILVEHIYWPWLCYQTSSYVNQSVLLSVWVESMIYRGTIAMNARVEWIEFHPWQLLVDLLRKTKQYLVLFCSHGNCSPPRALHRWPSSRIHFPKHSFATEKEIRLFQGSLQYRSSIHCNRPFNPHPNALSSHCCHQLAMSI